MSSSIPHPASAVPTFPDGYVDVREHMEMPGPPSHEIVARQSAFLAEGNPERAIRKTVRRLAKGGDPFLRLVLTQQRTGSFAMFRVPGQNDGRRAWAMVPGNLMRERYGLMRLDDDAKEEMRGAGWLGPRDTDSMWWINELQSRDDYESAVSVILFGDAVALWSDYTQPFRDVALEVWDCRAVWNFVGLYPPASFFFGGEYGFLLIEMLAAGHKVR